MKTTLNTIAPKSSRLNASEASGTNTVWDNLIALSKFAGGSKPEREDATAQLKYAIDNYEMRDWHKEVLQGIIAVLTIDPRL